jgi:hypothetical protein
MMEAHKKYQRITKAKFGYRQTRDRDALRCGVELSVEPLKRDPDCETVFVGINFDDDPSVLLVPMGRDAHTITLKEEHWLPLRRVIDATFDYLKARAEEQREPAQV